MLEGVGVGIGGCVGRARGWGWCGDRRECVERGWGWCADRRGCVLKGPGVGVGVGIGERVLEGPGVGVGVGIGGGVGKVRGRGCIYRRV